MSTRINPDAQNYARNFVSAVLHTLNNIPETETRYSTDSALFQNVVDSFARARSRGIFEGMIQPLINMAGRDPAEARRNVGLILKGAGSGLFLTVMSFPVMGFLTKTLSPLSVNWAKGRADVARTMAEKLLTEAKHAGQSALLQKGIGGVLASLATATGGFMGFRLLKTHQEIKVAQAKAKAEVWADAEKRRELLRDAIEVIKPEEVADAGFEKIIGQEKAIEKFEGVVDRICNPQDYADDLDKSSRLVVPTMLVGPPGTGKTDTMRALINTCRRKGVSPLFIRLRCNQLGFRDTGAKVLGELRKMLKESKQLPIILMDEFDSIPSRLDPKAELKDIRLTNALLEEIDGVSNDQSLWFAITNHPEKLDSGIHSRFTDQIPYSLPNAGNRLQIFNQNIDAKRLHALETIDWDSIVKASEGFSGRDIKGAVELLKERMITKKQRAPQGGHTFMKAQLAEAVADIARKKPVHQELLKVVADETLAREREHL